MALDCGVDIGSTNLKVVLVNEEGRTVQVRSVPSPRIEDSLGPVTDALALVGTLEGLIIEGWSACGMAEPLRSITCAGVGEDGMGVDDRLHPTGPAIPWFDRRAASEVDGLKALGEFSGRTGIAIDYDRTIAKWAWMRKHHPQQLDGARHWVALTDFPAVWWSGRAFMSASLAPRTACFDVLRRAWLGQLLEVVGAPRLPDILGAGVAVGRVRRGGLRESGAVSEATVIAAGGHDHPVAASIIRRWDPAGIVDSLGTANLLYGELPAGNRLPHSTGLAFSLPPAGGEMISCLGVLELSAALGAVRQRGDAFWAFLRQRRFPGQPPPGLHSLTSDSSDIRRVLEHVSLHAKGLLQDMLSAGVAAGPIYTSGGWSRSPGFAELRASIFGQPIMAVRDMEVTAVGAALFGAKAATGRTESPLRSEDITVVEPVAEWAAAYQKIFEEWKNSY